MSSLKRKMLKMSGVKEITPKQRAIKDNLLVVLCILGGILITIPGILLQSVENFDETYQALSVRFYQDSPLAPLTFFLGNIWNRIFGDTLLNLRILQLLCYFVSIGIGCLIFYKMTSRKVMAAVLFMVLYASSRQMSMYLYGWDTGAYPFAMLCMASVFAYISRPSHKLAALTGVTAALFSMSRIPSVVIIPIIVFFIFRFRGDKKGKLEDLVCFSVCLLISLIGIVLMIYGNFGAFFKAWNPDNIITGHSPYQFHRHLKGIIEIAPRELVESLIPITCVIAGVGIVWVKKKKLVVIVTLCVIISIITLSLLWILPIRIFFGGWLLIFIVALFYNPLSGLFYKQVRNQDEYNKKLFWVVVVFAVVPIIGSDRLLERWMVLPLLPVALVLCYRDVKKYILPIAWFMMVAVVTMTVAKNGVWIYEGLNRMSAISPRLAGMCQGDEVYRAVEDVQNAVERLNKEDRNYTFVGLKKYLGAYVADPDCLYNFQHFHYLDFEKDKEMYERRLIGYDAIIVMPTLYSYSEMNDAFFDFLGEHGYEKTTQGKYSDRYDVYIRTTAQGQPK